MPNCRDCGLGILYPGRLCPRCQTLTVQELGAAAAALDIYAEDLAHVEALREDDDRGCWPVVGAETYAYECDVLASALDIYAEESIRLREALTRLVAAGRNVSGPVLAYHANPTIETLLAKGRAMAEYTAALARAEEVLNARV